MRFLLLLRVLGWKLLRGACGQSGEELRSEELAEWWDGEVPGGRSAECRGAKLPNAEMPKWRCGEVARWRGGEVTCRANALKVTCRANALKVKTLQTNICASSGGR